MAKRLGFGPDALVRSRPGPKQRWKLPVKDWVRELHLKRFGHVIGPDPLAVLRSNSPVTPDGDADRWFEAESEQDEPTFLDTSAWDAVPF